MSFHAILDNRTPFSASSLVQFDKSGQEVLLVVLSATFVTANGRLVLAEDQVPIRQADVPYGMPGQSSPRYEGDFALEKPFVDVIVNGTAYAPHGRAASTVLVQLGIGDVRKTLQVSGDRYWERGLTGRHPCAAASFQTMPIVYERAAGGSCQEAPGQESYAVEPRNPVGVGFRGALSRDPTVKTEVPNVEYLNDRMSSPQSATAPAGFGIVGRGWQPRISFAGTFDDKWLKEQWPLLPQDFDVRHYQAAPHDQQSATIVGGETVLLVNLTPDGRWLFPLPRVHVPLRFYYDTGESSTSPRMDTVLIEPDLRRVTLTCRARLRTVRNGNMLREIVLGNMSPGWLRARTLQKDYLDWKGNGGSSPSDWCYEL